MNFASESACLVPVSHPEQARAVAQTNCNALRSQVLVGACFNGGFSGGFFGGLRNGFFRDFCLESPADPDFPPQTLQNLGWLGGMRPCQC